MRHVIRPTPPARVVGTLYAALLLLPIAAGACISWLPGGAVAARELVSLAFEPGPARLSRGLAIATANVKVAALPVMAAVVLGAASREGDHKRLVRNLFDVVLAAVMAVNMMLLALAVGGYGLVRLLPWLPHWPLEAGGLAVTFAAYLDARRRPPSARELGSVTAGAAVLLGAAAMLETFATPHV